MAFTQAQLLALEEAIACGTLKVRYADGKEVTYRSLQEMMTLRATMREDVGNASGIRQTLAEFSDE